MTESAALQALQRRLGHHFARPTLLVQALTHRSFGAEHNERLEFLGDAVLSLGVSALLYERFSGSDEGDLTRVRAHLVREDSLHRAALALGLPEVLRLSEGEGRGGGAQRPSILADAVEALIGAVFLDGGYAPAQTVVQRLFGEVIQSTEADSWAKDARPELRHRSSRLGGWRQQPPRTDPLASADPWARLVGWSSPRRRGLRYRLARPRCVLTFATRCWFL